MNIDEYRKKAEKQMDWAPGWEAIDSCLNRLYPGIAPMHHYASPVPHRAIWGGDEYLDGVSVFESKQGHLHIVTYGMSELYANEEAFGGEWSKWGYEMTIRLPLSEKKDHMWAVQRLSSLARYTSTTNQFFEQFQFFTGDGTPLKFGSKSRLTGFLIVADPELPCVDTLHGKLEFLQLVGITQQEVDALLSDSEKVHLLYQRICEENRLLITDPARSKSYL